MAQIDQFLQALVEKGGSDLHLSTGSPPVMRVHGRLQRVRFRELTPRDTEVLLREIMGDEVEARLQEEMDLDFAYEVEGLARFRVSVFRQRKGLAAVLRAVPFGAPDADELGLPSQVQELCALPEGLVLVTGPSGSGRSTTLAALVDRINRTRGVHVLTVEDPVEFVHENRTSLVNQREVGTTAGSVPRALRAALREDPDVVMVGDLDVPGALEPAVSAAAGGHLVLGALSTPSARATLVRVLDAFPADRRESARTVLADCLRGVVSLALLRSRDGEGRVAAREILLGTPAVAELVREGRIHQIPTLVQTGKREGMRLLDQDILELLMADRISPEEAFRACRNKEAFRRYLDDGPAAAS